jgi:hypothetical protein
MAWVSQWRGRWCGSRGGGADGVGLAMELSGRADSGCVDFHFINNE